MKTKYLFKILLLFGIISLVSCESKDGDWERMKWDPKNTQNISVPDSGDTFTFKCKNYNSFWLTSVAENGKMIDVEPVDSDIKGEWYSIDIENNIITIVIYSNSDTSNRTLNIGVTAGDIFDEFSFDQQHSNAK